MHMFGNLYHRDSRAITLISDLEMLYWGSGYPMSGSMKIEAKIQLARQRKEKDRARLWDRYTRALFSLRPPNTEKK
jgi:hypothetical protein